LERILVVEDEPDLRKVLASLLKREGYRVDLAESGTKAMEMLNREVYDLLITDVRLPGPSGIEVLRATRELYPDAPVIIITAFASDEVAEEARRHGAFNYITKPFDNEKIVADVGIALGWKRLGNLMASVAGKYRFDQLVARSEKMKTIMETVAQVAATSSTVLLTGESGTGKELIARAIHHNSARRDRPFVSINCGALPDELLESELFGHTKGSFTGAIAHKKGFFEVADGGTIFLDEIGDTSPAMQIKLLRSLQEKTIRRVGGTEEIAVDVRVVAATNQDLESLVKEKRFREDLFYRINVIPIKLPPLRDRPEDIPHLAYHFFDRYKQEMGKKLSGISDEAMAALSAYHWPGNIRELQNVIERCFALAPSADITLASLSHVVREPRASAEPSLDFGSEVPSLETMERLLMAAALRQATGNKNQAARILGIDRQRLYRKLQRYGLE